MTQLNGQDISNIYTLGSMYDNNCVAVDVGENVYRLPAKVILAMVNEFTFTLDKKRKHTYLIKPEPMFDENGLRPEYKWDGDKITFNNFQNKP